jgi:hypothetical protein
MASRARVTRRPARTYLSFQHVCLLLHREIIQHISRDCLCRAVLPGGSRGLWRDSTEAIRGRPDNNVDAGRHG